MISLCTWVKDWPPLRATLEHNARLIAGRDVEWCITDFRSSDDTWPWLQRCASQWPQLRVFRAECEPLHFARAYNRAFRAARGNVLVCLDADNFLGPRFIETVHDRLSDSAETVLHCWSGQWQDGTCGRIALSRAVFDALGGYDESFGPCGFQDLDLLDRARAARYRVITLCHPAIVGASIWTSRAAKLQHLAVDDYMAVNRANFQRSRENLAAGKWKANQT